MGPPPAASRSWRLQLRERVVWSTGARCPGGGGIRGRRRWCRIACREREGRCAPVAATVDGAPFSAHDPGAGGLQPRAALPCSRPSPPPRRCRRGHRRCGEGGAAPAARRRRRTGAHRAAMKQAAELALIDAGNANITLITKDTAGRPMPRGPRRRRAERRRGSDSRPAARTRGAGGGPVARSRNVPVIAFSSQSSAAQAGVYLMSFLPRKKWRTWRALRHFNRHSRLRCVRAAIAVRQIIERAIQQATQRYGATLALTERFERSGDVSPPPSAWRTAADVRQLPGPDHSRRRPELQQVASALSTAGLTRSA